MVVIQGRVRKFQKALLSEYVEGKSSGDWAALSHELNLRRQDVNDEIKKSLGKRGKKHSKELNNLLDESWKELFAAVSGGTPLIKGSASGLSSDDGKACVAENVTASRNASGASSAENVVPVEDGGHVEKINSSAVDEAGAVEELEPLDVDEVAAVDEAGPSEDGGASNVEEAEAVEELEPSPIEDNSASIEDVASPIGNSASSVEDAAPPKDATTSSSEDTASPKDVTTIPDEEIFSLVEEFNKEDDDVPDLPPEESEKTGIKKRGSLMELASQAAERATEKLDVNRVKTTSLLQHALRLKEEKENESDNLDFEIYSPDFSFLDKEENK